MNFIDKVVTFVSPRAGYERAAYRDALKMRSAYDAADISKANHNWRVLNNPAQIEDKPERSIVRARARDLERNTDVTNGILGAFERNVIGKGFNMQAKTDDEKIDSQLEELWNEWCKAKNCDVTGQQNFRQILKMALRRKKVDGGMLLLKVYTKGGLLPFKLQALEVDELDNNQITPRKKGNRVVDGIEYNEYNRPVGYWIKQYSLDGMIIQDTRYYDAKDVIFYWEKNRPSQVREMSDLAPAVTRIRDSNEFINAVSIKERVAACLAVFIRRANPVNSLGRQARGSGPEISYDGMTLTPGMIGELNPGDQLDVVNPASSGEDSAAFLKVQQRMIASGQGLSYEAVSRDMSETNYSSARQAIIEDENTYYNEADIIMERVMDEVYETFVISCVLTGKVNIPDFWSDKIRYLKHTWVASPKKWIDPSKEATANKIALETGQKSWVDICAESGKDWKEQIDNMAKANEYAREKGVEIGGILNGKKQSEGSEAATAANGN